MKPPEIVLCPSTAHAPEGADILTIQDDSDAGGFLGYHRVTPDGKPYARVFVNSIFMHGGEMLTTSLSVSTVMSHEICEWFVNPFLNVWAEGPKGQYAVEICDPVAEETYEINGVSVSNFVCRRYFDARAPQCCTLDHLGTVSTPFSVRPGGRIRVCRTGKMEDIRGPWSCRDWTER